MTGKQIRINHFYRQKLTELTLLLDQAKGLVPNHNPSIGYIGEELLRNFLRKELPTRFNITQGFIEHNGYVSPQCDIIIYDAYERCPLYSFGNIDVIQSSAVKATIEVKTSITPTRFHSVLTSFNKLAEMGVNNNHLIVFNTPKPESFEKYFFHTKVLIREYDVSDYEYMPQSIVSLNHNYCLKKGNVQDDKNDYYGYVASRIQDRSGNIVSCLQIFIDSLMKLLMPKSTSHEFESISICKREECEDDLADLKYIYQFPICTL